MTDLAFDAGALDPEILLSPEELAYLTDDELGEYLRAVQVCSTLDGEWAMQPHQQHAEDVCEDLMARGDIFEVLFGGQGGPGKSEWLLWHLYQLALRFPGFEGMLLRTTFPELNRTAILRSLARFDSNLATYNATNKVWNFTNGSHLWFGYVEHPRDVFQYDSFEADCFAFDELTQHPTDYAYRYLFSRLRTTIGKTIQGLVPHMISGTNPHRAGVAWVKPRFIDVGQPNVVHRVDLDLGDDVPSDGVNRVTNRVFIPAKLDDNRFINRGAYRQALAHLDEATRKAIEDGSWDVVEGQFFREWDRRYHVIDPIKIPGWWTTIGGYDFGLANPMAYYVIAFDGDGSAYVIREVYGAEMLVSEQARRIKAVEAGLQVKMRVGDPSIWNRTGAGVPIAQQFSEQGVIFRRGMNARVDGWIRLREYLARTQRVEDPVTLEITFAPKLFVFSTCVNLVRTLPMLVHDEKNPEDLDTDGEDHAADAVRYALMTRPLPSRQPIEERALSREERFEAWYRQHALSQRSGIVEHPVLGDLES